jgi:hypothetical protein
VVEGEPKKKKKRRTKGNDDPWFQVALGLARTSGFSPQRPITSCLCARTVKETQRSHIFLTIWCRIRAKRRKRFWVHPLVSERLLKRQFHKLYEDLRMHPKKFSGYFRMTGSSFDELLSMIRPKITYRNTVMWASVPPEERLAVTLR